MIFLVVSGLSDFLVLSAFLGFSVFGLVPFFSKAAVTFLSNLVLIILARP